MAVVVAIVPVVAAAAAVVLVPAATDQGTGSPAGQHVVVKNTDAANTAFIGPAGVTAANGFPLTPTAPPLPLDLEPGEVLYVFGTLASTIAVLRTGA